MLSILPSRQLALDQSITRAGSFGSGHCLSLKWKEKGFPLASIFFNALMVSNSFWKLLELVICEVEFGQS